MAAAGADTRKPARTVQPQPPQPRALLTLQAQIAQGGYAERHLEGIADRQRGVDELQKFLSLLQCTQEAQNAMQADAPKPRAVQMRNLVCVCHAVCPAETEAWVHCYRSLVKHQKMAARSDNSAAVQVPASNCEYLKRQLELCTQYASTRLLHAAVLPKDRQGTSL